MSTPSTQSTDNVIINHLLIDDPVLDWTHSTRQENSGYLGDDGAKMILIPQVNDLMRPKDRNQASFWAALWLMPVEALQALLDGSRTSKRSLVSSRLVVLIPHVSKLVRIFRGRDPDTPVQGRRQYS
ncbi:hypothetical protein CGRA01v4_01981 [Colletotrichum graminicola]|nr:hypothetical protein CGRA01v4_01981 [Colletotrichum graminicola]